MTSFHARYPRRLCFALLAFLASCASPPPVPDPKCPACDACPVCPLTPAVEPAPPVEITPPAPEPPRGHLERTAWASVPGWNGDDAARTLGAFAQGCVELQSRAEWRDICARALAIANTPRNPAAASFFRDYFEPYRVVSFDNTDTGLVTGYYEPLLHGSRVAGKRFKYPIYAAPQDLITVDLAEVYPDLKFRRLRGRLVGNKLVPYLDRSEIDSPAAPLKGLEIAFVDDAVELFFLQIQGSGQIELPDGKRIRVGYADQNGHPFRSLGGALIRRGEIKAERASMQGIKEWAARHPRRVQQFMNANPSYVFFKELPNDLTGPIGTLGVPLTAERSLAVDPRVIPLGVPVFLSTTHPGTRQELNRLMVAQDTGGAIGGAVRADFYWGFGDDAGSLAGRMKYPGRMWVLLPAGYDPNQTAAPPPSNPPPKQTNGAEK